MNNLTELRKFLGRAERCTECGTITANLSDDHYAKWCCRCGDRLRGTYVTVEEILEDKNKEEK